MASSKQTRRSPRYDYERRMVALSRVSLSTRRRLGFCCELERTLDELRPPRRKRSTRRSDTVERAMIFYFAALRRRLRKVRGEASRVGNQWQVETADLTLQATEMDPKKAPTTPEQDAAAPKPEPVGADWRYSVYPADAFKD